MYSNVLLLPMLLPCVVRCLLLLFFSCVAYYNLSMAIHARCPMLLPCLLCEPLLRRRLPASHAGYKTQCGHSVRFRPQEEPLLSTGFRGFVSFGGYRWLFRLDTCPRQAIGPIGRSGRGLLLRFLLDRGELSRGLPRAAPSRSQYSRTHQRTTHLADSVGGRVCRELATPNLRATARLPNQATGTALRAVTFNSPGIRPVGGAGLRRRPRVEAQVARSLPIRLLGHWTSRVSRSVNVAPRPNMLFTWPQKRVGGPGPQRTLTRPASLRKHRLKPSRAVPWALGARAIPKESTSIARLAATS